MRTFLRSKMFYKVMILIVLLVGLSFVTLVKNVQTVNAMACCLDCEAGQQACEEMCYQDPINQMDNPNCPYASVQDCMNQTGVTYCFQHCSYQACGGGGCVDSWECPPGCVCTGFQCQCF